MDRHGWRSALPSASSAHHGTLSTHDFLSSKFETDGALNNTQADRGSRGHPMTFL